MSSTTQQGTKVQVTISDEEYSEMLSTRLAAKKAYEANDTSDELWMQYQEARAVVRRARKVRRTEGAVVENYKQQSAPQHQAMTRKAGPTMDEVFAEAAQATPVLIQVPARRTKVSQ